MSRWAWLTPDASTGYTVRELVIPSALLTHVGGALGELTLPDAWEQSGSLTPEEAAALAHEMLDRFYMPHNIGMIAAFMETWPEGWELAMGQVLLEADYPELYDACPSWRVSSPSSGVQLPDMRERMIIGVGSAYAPGDELGAAEHTLTLAEIPAHTHTVHVHGANVDIEPPVGVPDASASIPAPAESGSAGSGAAHNNLPPVTALYWAVKVS